MNDEEPGGHRRRECHEASYNAWSVAFLSTATLLPGTARALDFDRFHQWNDQVLAEYIAAMIDEMWKVLREEGKTQFANQVQQFFSDIKPGKVANRRLAGQQARTATCSVPSTSLDLSQACIGSRDLVSPVAFGLK